MSRPSRGARLKGAVQRQRERRAAEFGRVEAEEEMMHDRIADHGDLEDVAARDAGFLRRLADQRDRPRRARSASTPRRRRGSS